MSDSEEKRKILQQGIATSPMANLNESPTLQGVCRRCGKGGRVLICGHDLRSIATYCQTCYNKVHNIG